MTQTTWPDCPGPTSPGPAAWTPYSEMPANEFDPSTESRWRLIVAAAKWVLLSFICSFVVGFLIGFSGALLHVPAARRLIVSAYSGDLAAMGVLLISAIVRGRMIGRGSMSEGVGNRPIKNRLVVLCLVLVAIGYALLLRFVFGGGSIYDAGTAGSTAFWLLRLVVIAPLAEESLCRGWLWTGLRMRGGPLITILVTSAFWLACHVGLAPGKLIALVPMAFVLGFARHFGQSIRAPIILHAIYNFVNISVP